MMDKQSASARKDSLMLELTGEQRKAIREIFGVDLATLPIHRLLDEKKRLDADMVAWIAT
jgi:hypothetical protein